MVADPHVAIGTSALSVAASAFDNLIGQALRIGEMAVRRDIRHRGNFRRRGRPVDGSGPSSGKSQRF
jgi:hypothetical protein